MFHCFKTGYLLSLVHEVRYLDTNFSHGSGGFGEAHAHDPEVREREVFATLYYDLSRTAVSKDKFSGWTSALNDRKEIYGNEAFGENYPEFCQWFWEDKPSRSPSCWLAVPKIFSHVPFGLNLRILEINSIGDNLYKRHCSELTKSYSPFLVFWKIMNVTSKLDRALHTSSQKGKQKHSRRFSLGKHSAWFTLLSFTRPHSWGRVYSQKIEYVVSLTSVSRWSWSLKAAT